MIFGKTVLLLSKSVKLTRVILLIALGALLASCGNSGTSSGVENLRAPGVVPLELVDRYGAGVEICYVVDQAPALFYSVMEGSSHRVDLQVTVYSTPEYALAADEASRYVRFTFSTDLDDGSFCADDNRNESLGPIHGCKYETSAGSHTITKGRHLLAGYKANGPQATRVKSGAYAADYEASSLRSNRPSDDGCLSYLTDLSHCAAKSYIDKHGKVVTWNQSTLYVDDVALIDTLEDSNVEEGREIVKYRTNINVIARVDRYSQSAVPMCGGDALPTGLISKHPRTYETETFVWIDDGVDTTIGQDQPCAKDSAGECM